MSKSVIHTVKCNGRGLIKSTILPECKPLPERAMNGRTGRLGSISSTFYVQPLTRQTPNVQKRPSSQAAFCAFGIYGRKSCT